MVYLLHGFNEVLSDVTASEGVCFTSCTFFSLKCTITI